MNISKKLVKVPSGHSAEAVYYESDTKQVICFSTQLNCAVGCTFCASTLGEGATVNLTVSDMLRQVHEMEQYNTSKVMLFSIMGEGEPFLNYKNVMVTMRALQERANCKIAVSTSGYKIKKFAHEKFNVPVKLQVSVHSAIQYKREIIMPNAPTVHSIKSDLAYFHEHNDSKVELNFTLIKDFNDSLLDMQYIIDMFPNEHIKLTKMNGELGLAKSEECLKYLKDNGMSVEYQESPGADIAAGCGQTRGMVAIKPYEWQGSFMEGIHPIGRY